MHASSGLQIMLAALVSGLPMQGSA